MGCLFFDADFLKNISYTFGTSNFGFAGGFSPDNITSVVAKISSYKFPGKKPWIDMESGVRTNNRFDVEKVLTVIKKIK